MQFQQDEYTCMLLCLVTEVAQTEQCGILLYTMCSSLIFITRKFDELYHLDCVRTGLNKFMIAKWNLQRLMLEMKAMLASFSAQVCSWKEATLPCHVLSWNFQLLFKTSQPPVLFFTEILDCLKMVNWNLQDGWSKASQTFNNQTHFYLLCPIMFSLGSFTTFFSLSSPVCTVLNYLLGRKLEWHLYNCLVVSSVCNEKFTLE